MNTIAFFEKICALAIIVLSLFIAIAIFDYHPEDPSYLHAVDTETQNITSKYGANIADPIIQAFGYTILWPIVFLIFHSMLILTSKKIRLLLLRLGIVILTLPIFCFLVAHLDNATIADGDYYSFHMGGYLGYYLKSEVTYADKPYVFTITAIIICTVSFLFALGVFETFSTYYKQWSLHKHVLKHKKTYMLSFSNLLNRLFKSNVVINNTTPQCSSNTHREQDVIRGSEIFFKQGDVQNTTTHSNIPFVTDAKKSFDVQTDNLGRHSIASSQYFTTDETTLATSTKDKKYMDADHYNNAQNATFDLNLQQSPNNTNTFDISQLSITNNALANDPFILSEPVEKKSLSSQPFVMPDADMLHHDISSVYNTLDNDELEVSKQTLLGVLNDFGIRGMISDISCGPVITLYELEPVSGTKSARVIGLADDIARSMSAVSARIAVIPGKNAIGIELPNETRQTIYLRELISSDTYTQNDYQLPLALGKNISGEVVVVDLSKMPHLLVAGTTGAGKSIAIHAMIMSLLYKHIPDECKLVMIDPKMLELSVYDGIPHLLAPVITTPEKAVSALKWVVSEMESRYRAMSVLNVRNISSYNKFIREAQSRSANIEKQIQVGFDKSTGKPIFESIIIKSEILPYIVVIVDEMADLMVVAGKDIETSVQRLAQMARAAGIHLIMATQRPSVDVITGVIKANFPTRIAFQVASKFDSRVILGEVGAEQLLGAGDMLHMRAGGRIERLHGVYVQDTEIEKVVKHLKTQAPPNYAYDIPNFEAAQTPIKNG